MAAGWRGAWRSRVASSKEQQDAVQVYQAVYCHPNQSHIYNCSRSGTASLSTTAYTASSSFACVSAQSLVSSLAAAPPPVVEIVDQAGEVGQGGGVTYQEKAKTREHIRDLLISGGTAMDKWLSELRVSWVLHLAELEPASARRAFISRRLQHTAHSWALALRLMSRSIVCFTGWCSNQQEEEDVWWPPASEFVRFVVATFLQILPFVDVLVALDTTNPSSEHSAGSAVPSVVHKFQTLADVREALSGASEQVLLWHLWLDDAEATRISAEMSSLLLAKLDKLDEAIRDTRDYIRAQSMSLMTQDDVDDDSLKISSELLDQTPDVHKVTRSVTSYIIVLSTSQDRPAAVVDPPVVEEACLLNTLTMTLEKKLTRLSHSFQDQSLRFLFLINNLYFVWHQLRTDRLLDTPMKALARKIDSYIKSYLQVSWAPVLKPLQNNAFCCFTGYSAKRKFESKFDKTYDAQKLWKVPDPELREEPRTAIANRVISAFTSFLEDTGISASSKLTAESLEEMLEELFEG